MIASLQLLHTLPGCCGGKRFGEIFQAESRDFEVIDATQKRQATVKSFMCETLGICLDIHIVE